MCKASVVSAYTIRPRKNNRRSGKTGTVRPTVRRSLGGHRRLQIDRAMLARRDRLKAGGCHGLGLPLRQRQRIEGLDLFLEQPEEVQFCTKV